VAFHKMCVDYEDAAGLYVTHTHQNSHTHTYTHQSSHTHTHTCALLTRAWTRATSCVWRAALRSATMSSALEEAMRTSLCVRCAVCGVFVCVRAVCCVCVCGVLCVCVCVCAV